MAEIKMTPELQEELAGLLPVSRTAGVPFKLPGFESEKLKQFAIVITQRGYTENEIREYNSAVRQDMDSKGYSKQKVTAEYMSDIARKTVINFVRPVYDLNGEKVEMEFGENGLLSHCWEKLPMRHRARIHENALVLSGLREREKQGLESQPPQAQE